MTTKIVGSLLLLACAAAQTGGSAVAPLACNLKALAPEARVRHAKLTRAVFSAVAERRALDDGYQFRLDSAKVPIADLGQWIAWEHQCCPFFRFRMEVDEAGALWLALSGGQGVKGFIEAEFR